MSEGPKEPEPSARRLALGMLGAGVCVAVFALLHLREWVFLCDDAYIAFRHARNLGVHGVLAFNLPPHARVEGYTDFLWVLVLAGGEAVGLRAPGLSLVLCASASLLGLGLCFLLAAELRRFAVSEPGPRFAATDLLAPALLAATPEWMVWGSSGLETSLAACLVLAASLAWMRGGIELAGGLASLAGLVRLDSLVFIAAFGGAWLVIEGARVRSHFRLADLPVRRLAIALALFAVPLLAHVLFRRVYYGTLLPHTFAVKRHGALLRDTWGVEYLLAWARALHLVYLVPLVAFVRARHALLLVPIVATCVYAWSVGGDFMAYSRFLVPATAAVALLVGWLLADIKRLAKHPAIVETVALVIGVSLVVAQAATLPGRVARDHDEAWLEGRFESVTAMERFARVRIAAGTALRSEVPEDTLVVVGAAGALPYASELPAVDAYGLVDPGVLANTRPRVGEGARPGHQLHASLDYLRTLDPDLLCHVGHVGPRRPSRRAAVQKAGPGSVWACVETGPIPDRRSEGGVMDGSFYCCIRHADDVVGNFGGSEG